MAVPGPHPRDAASRRKPVKAPYLLVFEHKWKLACLVAFVCVVFARNELGLRSEGSVRVSGPHYPQTSPQSQLVELFSFPSLEAKRAKASLAKLLIASCEGATGAAECVVHEAQAEALQVKLLVFGSGANQSLVALSLPKDEGATAYALADCAHQRSEGLTSESGEVVRCFSSKGHIDSIYDVVRDAVRGLEWEGSAALQGLLEGAVRREVLCASDPRTVAAERALLLKRGESWEEEVEVASALDATVKGFRVVLEWLAWHNQLFRQKVGRGTSRFVLHAGDLAQPAARQAALQAVLHYLRFDSSPLELEEDEPAAEEVLASNVAGRLNASQQAQMEGFMVEVLQEPMLYSRYLTSSYEQRVNLTLPLMVAAPGASAPSFLPRGKASKESWTAGYSGKAVGGEEVPSPVLEDRGNEDRASNDPALEELREGHSSEGSQMASSELQAQKESNEDLHPQASQAPPGSHHHHHEHHFESPPSHK